MAKRTLGSCFSFAKRHTHSCNFEVPQRKVSAETPTMTNPARWTPSVVAQSHDHCKELVFKGDYPHYFCSGFIPHGASRQSFLAIRALNVEVASLMDRIKQEEMLKLRLMWWKQEIDNISKGNPSDNPISIALTDILSKNIQLTKSFLKMVIDRRLNSVDYKQPAEIEDLEHYSEGTASSLLYLQLECLGIRNTEADHAASHIGKALGICTILRSLPFHFTQRHCYLPVSVTSKNKIVVEDLYQGQRSSLLQDGVFEVASVAKVHLDHAKDLATTCPANSYRALISAQLAQDFLTKLQKVDFDIFNSSLHRSLPLSLQCRMLWYAYRKKIL